MNNAADIGLVQVAWSLILVGVAVGVSIWWKISAEKEMMIGSVRSFIQLIAVGYALEFVFNVESPWPIHLAIAVMMAVGAYTASTRVKNFDGALVATATAMVLGSFVTLGALLLLEVIEFKARYVIPLAGMVISNSMNASAISINRLVSDVRGNRLAIETALSLGLSWREASRKYFRDAATSGMISILNFMKTVGIVALPGAMTGMILGGAEPLEAVMLQMIVAYMLLGAVTVTSVVTVEMTIRRFFTSAHQLRSDL